MDWAICPSICLRGFELSSALCTTSTRGCRSTAQSKSSFFRTACLQSFSRPFSTKPPSKARHGVILFAASRKPLPSLKFRGKRVEEEVLSSQSKLLGIGDSLLGAALDAWAVAAGHDSKFWEASDVFLMIANCQAITREQSLRKDAPFPDSKFRILRKMVDGKEVLAFRVVPTAARQFDNPTISKRQRQGFPVEPWSCLGAGGKTDSTPGGRAGGRIAVQGQTRV